MAINQDVFKAILAMDTYNRGYNAGIDFGPGSDVTGTAIGTASIFRTKGDTPAQSAGFYASAYTLASGEKVISYRGTDGPSIASAQSIIDFWNGITIGNGYPPGQLA